MLLRSDLKNRIPLFEHYTIHKLSTYLNRFNGHRVTVFHYQPLDGANKPPVLVRTIGVFIIEDIYFYIQDGISNYYDKVWFTEETAQSVINIHTIDFYIMPVIIDDNFE